MTFEIYDHTLRSSPIKVLSKNTIDEVNKTPNPHHNQFSAESDTIYYTRTSGSLLFIGWTIVPGPQLLDYPWYTHADLFVYCAHTHIKGLSDGIQYRHHVKKIIIT